MNRNFRELLEAQWANNKFVCIGLDSEYKKIPESARTLGVANTVIAFNSAIVDATSDVVCAYKPNIAFYEAHGDIGWLALLGTIRHIHKVAPNVPVILDAKRADIGNTNNGYVSEAFELLRADAITVHPYFGAEALQPFLERKEKGIIVLCRTSDPGAGEFQDGEMYGRPLYQYVAFRVATRWNSNGNCAVVVGATYPEELEKVRAIVGDMPILIPGVGFQQKDVPLEEQVERVVSLGKDSRGRGMIINSSRGIIFASSGSDFAEAARQKTLELHTLVNQYRQW